MSRAALPSDHKGRKDVPLCTGVLDYFTAALAEVAKVSKAGNDQHNLGQELHWSRGKSTDHPDCIVRHLSERGTFDTDGQRHSAKLAWRALALLQEELEREGVSPSRGSRFPVNAKLPTLPPIPGYQQARAPDYTGAAGCGGFPG